MVGEHEIKKKICSTKWLLNMIPNQLRRNHCNNGQHMHKHKKNFGFLARSQPTICNIISSGDTNFIFPYFEKLFVWKFIVFQSGKNGMRVWQKSFESINKNTNKPFRLKSHLKREFRNDRVHLSNGKKNTPIAWEKSDWIAVLHC